MVEELVAALKPFADQGVDADSLCHIGLCSAEDCSRCGPILRARAAIDAVKKTAAQLSGSEIRKGTGDVLKDLAYAQRYMDGFTDSGLPGRIGLEVDFVERALRVAIGEIKRLREAVSKRTPTKVADL